MTDEEFILERREYIISRLIGKELLADDIYLEKALEHDMYVLTCRQRSFVSVLQEDREIIKVPSNNWEWFKSILGLKHKVKSYKLTEHVSFPNYKFPTNLGKPKVYLNMRTCNYENYDNSVSKSRTI